LARDLNPLMAPPATQRTSKIMAGSDELTAALHAYALRRLPSPKAGKPHRARLRASARRSLRIRTTANAAELSIDVGPLLAMPYVEGVREVAALAEDLADVSIERDLHIGVLVRHVADLIRNTAAQVKMPMQHFYTHLLIPALVILRSPKTRAFGLLNALVKSMWEPQDWECADEQCLKELVRLTQAYFVCKADLPTGMWMICHFKLDSVCPEFAFDHLFRMMLDDAQALRVFVSQAHPNEQVRVVHGIVKHAMNQEQGPKRRTWLCVAADVIAKSRLRREDFPEVARHKLVSWMTYIVHRSYFRVAKDYTHGDPELTAICVEQLVRKGAQEDAAVLYWESGSKLDMLLKPATLSKVQEAVTRCTPPVDVFAPLEATALELPLPESSVVWADTAETLAIAKAAVCTSAVVGVDLEWSSRSTGWLEPSLALLQLATTQKVFLVDLASEAIQDEIGSLFHALLGEEQPLVLGFSFDNDLRQLSRSPWRDTCQDVRGLCDLQRLESPSGTQEGLSSLVRRTMQRPLCKAEQRSCWHRRPLREAQRHYAALDAFVLLQIASILTDTSLDNQGQLADSLRKRRDAAQARAKADGKGHNGWSVKKRDRCRSGSGASAS